MKRLFHPTRLRPLLAGLALALQAAAQPPLPTPARPPVELFRELLNASPARREQLLASKSPAARDLIQKRIREFEALDPAQQDEAGWQLRLAQFRYYLSSLIQLPPDRRDPFLKTAPTEDLSLLQERLRAWDALPEAARAEVLESDRHLHLFVRQTSSDPARLTSALAAAPPASRPAIEAQFKRWSNLSDSERSARTATFQQFFDLSDSERSRAVRRLPDSDRVAMEKTLERFARLPEADRLRCLQGFDKLANLPPDERDEFLRNATRWQAMTPQERSLWRHLVLGTPPPPLPPIPSPASGVTNR